MQKRAVTKRLNQSAQNDKLVRAVEAAVQSPVGRAVRSAQAQLAVTVRHRARCLIVEEHLLFVASVVECPGGTLAVMDSQARLGRRGRSKRNKQDVAFRKNSGSVGVRKMQPEKTRWTA